MFLNKEKESRVKFNPGLSANRPPNNWTHNEDFNFNSSFKFPIPPVRKVFSKFWKFYLDDYSLRVLTENI